MPSSLIYNRGIIYTEVNKSKGLASELQENDGKQTEGPLQSVLLQLAWLPNSTCSNLHPENPWRPSLPESFGPGCPGLLAAVGSEVATASGGSLGKSHPCVTMISLGHLKGTLGIAGVSQGCPGSQSFPKTWIWEKIFLSFFNVFYSNVPLLFHLR